MNTLVNNICLPLNVYLIIQDILFYEYLHTGFEVALETIIS